MKIFILLFIFFVSLFDFKGYIKPESNENMSHYTAQPINYLGDCTRQSFYNPLGRM